MKNVCRNNHKPCEFAQANGYCALTVCKKDDEWKSIPNFSWYLVSNTGQIFDIAEEKNY